MNKVEKRIDRAGPLIIPLCVYTKTHMCIYATHNNHMYTYIHILKTTPKGVSVLDSSGIHIFS